MRSRWSRPASFVLVVLALAASVSFFRDGGRTEVGRLGVVADAGNPDEPGTQAKGGSADRPDSAQTDGTGVQPGSVSDGTSGQETTGGPEDSGRDTDSTGADATGESPNTDGTGQDSLGRVPDADIPDEDAGSSTQPDETEDDGGLTLGQEVVIADAEFVPSRLITQVRREVTFRNMSDTERSLQFLNWFIEGDNQTSPPIPPGGTYSITSETPISIAFQLVGQPEVRGSVLVEVGAGTI